MCTEENRVPGLEEVGGTACSSGGAVSAATSGVFGCRVQQSP